MSESLLNEIRAAKPVAPSELRDRVRAIAAEEPVREPFLARLRWRQLVLVAPATLLVALVAAGAIGLTRDGETRSADSPLASGAAEDSARTSPAPGAFQENSAAKDRALAPSTPGIADIADARGAEMNMRRTSDPAPWLGLYGDRDQGDKHALDHFRDRTQLNGSNTPSIAELTRGGGRFRAH